MAQMLEIMYVALPSDPLTFFQMKVPESKMAQSQGGPRVKPQSRNT